MTIYGSLFFLVDHSGSMSGQNALMLRTTVAALTKGTKAHGAFQSPEPRGCAGTVATVEFCLQRLLACGTIYIVTDSMENCWNGPLPGGSAHVTFCGGAGTPGTP